MKKSALVLSVLVTVSSVTPVVAMQNGQQQTSRWSRVAQNIFRTDLLSNMFGQIGQAVNSFTDFRENVDELVGDNKQENNNNQRNQNQSEGVATGVFNGVAQEVRNNLRQANIPGTEKVVNDNSMRLIKMGLIGVGFYMLMRIVINTFPKPEVQPQPRPASGRRFARHIPRNGRRRSR